VRKTIERPRSRKTPYVHGDERDKTSMQNSLVFHPWFLPRKITYAIRRLLPPEHKFKMRDYFGDHGCLRCDVKQGYCALGLCERCYTKLHSRLQACVRKRARLTSPQKYGNKYLEDARTARKLLKGFPSKMYVNARSRRGDSYRIKNPARAAFVVLNNCAPRS
jgi:hypothetical protein